MWSVLGRKEPICAHVSTSVLGPIPRGGPLWLLSLSKRPSQSKSVGLRPHLLHWTGGQYMIDRHCGLWKASNSPPCSSLLCTRLNRPRLPCIPPAGRAVSRYKARPMGDLMSESSSNGTPDPGSEHEKTRQQNQLSHDAEQAQPAEPSPRRRVHRHSDHG